MPGIELSPAVEQRLDQLASRTGRSKTSFVEQALLHHFEGLEDIDIAEDRLDNLLHGSTSAIPLEDVMKEHGSLED